MGNQGEWKQDGGHVQLVMLVKLSFFGIVCGFSLVKRKTDIKNSSLENIAGDLILRHLTAIHIHLAVYYTVEVMSHYRCFAGGCDIQKKYWREDTLLQIWHGITSVSI